MLVCAISKVVGMLFGLLYPAYASYLAVKNKDVRGYVQWMMYWIVFAFYTFMESFTDTFLGPWFPFYYEFKICFLLWLMSPQTGGAGFLYRRFLHPKLVKYEPEIDLCLMNVQSQTSSFIFQWANRIIAGFIQTVSETLRRGAIRASNHEVISQHILRTLSLNAIHQAAAVQPSNTVSRLPSSVGASPSHDMDMDAFFGAAGGGMNFHTTPDRVFLVEEESVSQVLGSDMEVEITEIEEPDRKAAKKTRRKKEAGGRFQSERRKYRRAPVRVTVSPKTSVPPARNVGSGLRTNSVSGFNSKSSTPLVDPAPAPSLTLERQRENDDEFYDAQEFLPSTRVLLTSKTVREVSSGDRIHDTRKRRGRGEKERNHSERLE